jgi:hypothetical protein
MASCSPSSELRYVASFMVAKGIGLPQKNDRNIIFDRANQFPTNAQTNLFPTCKPVWPERLNGFAPNT